MRASAYERLETIQGILNVKRIKRKFEVEFPSEGSLPQRVFRFVPLCYRKTLPNNSDKL